MLLSCGSGKLGIGWFLQLLARRHVSISKHSGQLMAWSPIMDGNVPPHTQSRIETSAKFLGLATAMFSVAQPMTCLALKAQLLTNKASHFLAILWWSLRQNLSQGPPLCCCWVVYSIQGCNICSLSAEICTLVELFSWAGCKLRALARELTGVIMCRLKFESFITLIAVPNSVFCDVIWSCSRWQWRGLHQMSIPLTILPVNH